MSDTTPDPKKRRGFGRNPTAAYRGGTAAWYGWSSAALDGAPVFTWLDVPRMLRDPHVRFLEKMWRAPFQKVKWRVKAESEPVAKFVDTTLRRFWRRSLPKLLSRYFRFGYAPGGAEFCAPRNLWRLERVRAIEPPDAAPRVWARGPNEGQPAGYTLNAGEALTPGTGAGARWVGPPHAFWFAGHADLTPWHDTPPISGLFDPWLEKRGRNGAIHSRKLWFRKAAWRGGMMYHPPGETNVGTDEDPQMRDNQDIARESLDYMESGSVLTLENELLQDGTKAWEYKEAQALSDVAGVREYPQDLDREMSTGAGIPPEVLEASEVGSGWSGRLIPLLGYLGTVDELAGLVVESADQWLRPLVGVNFGRKSWYEVEPLSLVDEMQQQQGKGGGGAPQNPAQLFDGKPPPEQPPEQKPLTLSTTLAPDARPPEQPPHRYSSVYVELPPALAQRIRQLGMRIPSGDLADRGREEDPHVTIRYGLETDDAERVRPILSDAGPVKFRLGAAAVFAGDGQNKPYDVVMVEVESPDLRRLNRELASLPHTDTFPTYRPHATIAYVKAGLGESYAKRFGALNTDATVTAAVFSDRVRNHTTIPFGRTLSATQVPFELSWSPYEGPKGGKGWVSDTGEVRYQTEKPADDEAGQQGPEGLFDHPDYAGAHQPPADGFRSTALHAWVARTAAEHGVDPADLHRAAAGHLESAVRGIADPANAKSGAIPQSREEHVRTAYARAAADAERASGDRRKVAAAAHFADSYFEADNPHKRAQGYLKGVADGTLDADHLPEDARSAIVEDLAQLPPTKLAEHAAAVLSDYDDDTAESRIARAAVDAAAAARPVKPLAFDGSAADKHLIVTPDEVGEDAFNGLKAAAQLLPGVKAPLDGDRALLVKAGTPLAKLAAAHGATATLADAGGLKPLFASLRTGYQLPLEHVPESAKDYGGTSGSKGSGEYQPEESWDAAAVPVYKRVNEDWYVKMRSAADEAAPEYELVHRKDAPPLARLPEVYWKNVDPENADTDDDLVEAKQKRDAKVDPKQAPALKAAKKDIGEWRSAIKQLQGSAGKLRQEWHQALKGVPEEERPEEPDWDEPDASALTDQHDSREDHTAALEGLGGEYEDHLDALREHIEGAKGHAVNHRANSAASEAAQAEWEESLADVPEEERPQEPDWRDTLGGDPEHHAKFLKEHLDKAREAAEGYGKVHHEAAEKHGEKWREVDKGVKGWLDQGRRAQAAADADDALNEGINDALFSREKPFESTFSTDRADYPDEDAGDEAHAAIETVQGALDDLVNGSMPEHEDGPDPDDYTHDEADELPGRDEWDGTPAERAEHFETEAEEHKKRLKELAEAVPAYRDAVANRSTEWRGEMRGHLETVRDTVQQALKALPEGDYPGAAHRADLKDLLARVGKLLPKFAAPDDDATELSFTLEPDAAAGAPDAPPVPLQQVAQQTGGRLMRMRKAKLAQLLTLAMIRRQQQASERGNPRGAARSLAQLADLANDPDKVAELVGMAPLGGAPAPDGAELSWQPYIGKRGEKAGQQVGWFNPDSKEVRYQTAKPGEGAAKARGRTASGSAGLAIAHKVLGGTATAEDLGELVDHLQVMTVPRLKNVAAMLDKSLGGLKHRDKMVQALLGHVGGLTAADGTKADGAKATEPAGKPDAAPAPGEVRTVPTGSLKVDPKRFQFKLNTANPAGVTKELQEVKTFNPEFAGVVAVWRDPADGSDYVVNGHHRHELAGRTGHPNLAVRYLQAKDAREARAKGALINIAEGRGTAVDAAKFMRDMGVSPADLAKHGVSLKGKLAADAATLTKLNDAAFDRVARGTLDPERALAVARHLDSPDRQEKLFKLLAKREDEGKDLSDRTVEELARQMQAAPGVTTTNSTLWGDETSGDDTFVERGEMAAHVRAALSQEHNDFGAVASERRAGKVAGAGNSLNVGANKKRAAEAESAKNLYELTAHRKGAVAEALDAGAVKLKQARTKKERDRARTETLDAVRTALRERLAGPADGGGKGGVDQVGAAGSGTEPPAVAPAEAPADAGRGGEQPAGVAPEAAPHAASGLDPRHHAIRDEVRDSIAKVAENPFNLTDEQTDALMGRVRKMPGKQLQALSQELTGSPGRNGDNAAGRIRGRLVGIRQNLMSQEHIAGAVRDGLSPDEVLQVARLPEKEGGELIGRILAGRSAQPAPGATSPAPAQPVTSRPAYAPPTDPVAVASELQSTYQSLPPRQPGDGGPPIPRPAEVAQLIDRAEAVGKPLARGISSFLNGGQRYSYRMFHVARELLDRHEREAAPGRRGRNPGRADDANPTADEVAAASQPAAPSAAPPGAVASPGMSTPPTPAAGTPETNAAADHAPAIAAIPKGDSRFVAGHRVRRTADGKFQVERKGGYLTGDAKAISDHIRKSWENQQGFPSTPAALARASAYAEPDPFTDPAGSDRDAAARAKVPDGARAVSLDPDTHGRLGTVRRDAEGRPYIEFDGGEELKGADFEPLDAAHSWRAAEGERAARAPKGGSIESLFDASGPPPKSAPNAPAAPKQKPASQPDAPALFNSEPANLFNSAAEPAPPAPKATDRGSLDSIKESTDRALGIKQDKPPEPPKKGQYGAFLRGVLTDPVKFGDLEKLAPLPTLDRNELLAAVAEVYGPAVHADAKKKSKQGIVELLKGAKPA
jgi:2'-5' RNA ligase